MEETILDQMMPAPDEAPLTDCPWCGKEYSIAEEEPDDYELVVEPTPDTTGVYRHKLCGKLVRFV